MALRLPAHTCQLWSDYHRGGLDIGITPMRHHRGSFPQPLAVAALALGVTLTAVLTALVPGSRRAQAFSANARRTLPSAVTLAAVTI
jgi:hypothetical protein